MSNGLKTEMAHHGIVDVEPITGNEVELTILKSVIQDVKEELSDFHFTRYQIFGRKGNTWYLHIQFDAPVEMSERAARQSIFECLNNNMKESGARFTINLVSEDGLRQFKGKVPFRIF